MRPETSGVADLAACDREPIHIPGSIQPHGLLLALAGPDLRVTHASRNVAEWLGRDAEGLIGVALVDALGAEFDATIRSGLDGAVVGRPPYSVGRVSLGGDDRATRLDAILHRTDEALILELEPTGAAPGEVGVSRDIEWVAGEALARLQAAPTVEDLCRVAAAETRRIIGFDRALVYRFDEDWNGTVIAEDRNETLPSYMALRFPASDIPAQARELYRSNRVRLIADAGYTPAPIVPASGPGSGRPLDLRSATLRSVSPVHVEYMINMGTAASFSVSIVRDGELWGLLACHNLAPRHVPFRDRVACDFLGQVFSIQLEALAHRAAFERRKGRREAELRLLSGMTDADHFVEGLVAHGQDLLDLADATGAAILHDGQTTLIGGTPDRAEVDRIAEWLVREGREDVVARDSLEGLVPGASDFKDRASGLLAISISKLHRSFILWFRPEVIRTVAWGGDPTKAIVAEEGGRIHPRRSFETWLESVRYRSAPWKKGEVEAAVELRNAIVGIVLRRAEERAQFSIELERSNKELEAFSYSVSHDLRAPFRHIVGYSELLREEEGERLSPEGVRYLTTIIDAAHNAGTLVDNLLAFSRMGRTTIHPVPIDMNVLVREVVREVMMEAGGRSITWTIGDLPTIEGDLMMMRLALGNLASNAVKYTRPRAEAVVEIGAEHRGDETIFRVRDNGIGFDMRYVDKLFGVFQRLHRVEDFEGTGIGLANVRRIMGRHGGRAWAEGELGRGATFYFSLPRAGVSNSDGAGGRG